MLRITELTLPLHHPDEALPAAICKRLRITPRDLIRFVVARRGPDAFADAFASARGLAPGSGRSPNPARTWTWV